MNDKLLQYVLSLEDVLKVWDGLGAIRDINPIQSDLERLAPRLEAAKQAVAVEVAAFRAKRAA